MATLVLPLLVGCGGSESYPSRPITLVCPWAAGGGTDRVSRQMAMLLEQELGVPVSVINATGGKGVTGHSRGLNARPDGYTLTMMTLEMSTMHWAGLTDLDYRGCIPLLSVNEDYAALMVGKDAKWASIPELEEEVRQNPGKLTSSGTAVGGAWHLAAAGWLVAAGMDATDIVWIPSPGANPSLQLLVSGGVDMVCCSLPEARMLIESGEVRALGVMGPKRAKGFEDIPTFVEQGRDWELGAWRGLAAPLGTPPEVVDRLVQAIEKIVSQEPTEGTFAAFMHAQKFDNNWRRPDDFNSFLARTDEKLGTLLSSEAMRSVNEDRFSPMTYPTILMVLIGLTLAGLAVSSLRLRPDQAEQEDQLGQEQDVTESQPATIGGWINVAMVIAAILLYVGLADTVGFVPIASLILLVLLVRLGTRPVASLGIVIVMVPLVYIAFAYGLRVPLPPGLLG